MSQQRFLPVLIRLHDLARREAALRGGSYRGAFETVGLILDVDLGDTNYALTPRNAWSFARTCGDGVHYSLLEIGGRITDESPVVMSVPILGAAGNVVVGEDLHDFLCLGCEVGYFWLEQLVYSRAETIIRIGQGADAPEDRSEAGELLAALIREFDLRRWTGIENRLDNLTERYGGRLVLS